MKLRAYADTTLEPGVLGAPVLAVVDVWPGDALLAGWGASALAFPTTGR